VGIDVSKVRLDVAPGAHGELPHVGNDPQKVILSFLVGKHTQENPCARARSGCSGPEPPTDSGRWLCAPTSARSKTPSAGTRLTNGFSKELENHIAAMFAVL